MSLRWRIATALALVALAAGAGTAVTSYFSTVSQLQGGVDQALQASLDTATGDFNNGHGGRGDGPGGPADPGGGDCPDSHSLQLASAAQIISAAGAVTSCISGGPALPIYIAGASADRTSFRTITVSGSPYRVATVAWQGSETLEVARSLSETDSVLDRLRVRLLLVIVLAAAVAAALGWLIARQLARPIVRLRDTAYRIATTLDTSTPVRAGGPGEVGSLANSFATMVSAFDQSREQQRRLVADASHEMRTPLTSLRSNVELLGQIERLPRPERAEVVKDVLDDIDELSTLLAELVDLASDLTASEATESVHLEDLARAVAARVKRRSQRDVTVEVTDPHPVDGRPRQLERAIQNLVDNALKYTPEGTPIEIVVTASEVTVRDQGPGIATADLPRVFDRFYRSVESRTLPGSGLGLSIVDEVARGHGGKAFARNRPGGGAEVGFSVSPKSSLPSHPI